MIDEKLSIAFGEFWHVAWVLVVIIAGISILTGFVREYIPQEKFQKKLKNQNTIVGAFMGAALGTLTPFCSASMVPVAMGMIEMGAPFSTVLPFLISAPLCNFVVVGIIFGTFGWKVALIYLVWTFVGAIIAGLTVGRSRVKNQVKNLAEIAESKNKKSSESCCGEVKKESACSEGTTAATSCCQAGSAGGGTREKVESALNFALALFKQIVPYAIIGAVISGVALAFIPSSIVEKYVGNDSWYAIPLASAIGVPLYLRIEMAIPLLRTLLVKGMGMGAAVALLIGGTGASLPELAILSSMLKPKGVLAFTLTVLALAISGGFLFMFI
ncbi:permease [Oceanispirochaeta crateris]|uniref:Permease n=1 Tax=Oceanispirochaeta crateris TaxID=2518645 RepID=A0A5C1QKH2_9SPIO|nr:permease [Oceanispirochaeta crateris]QEN08613.1 permease [Oceanispirochaeta crateris]